ncbi:DUF6244 family protein [Polymorphospora sp. NPDC050346]|uniref:DUF6244 family protein n=1 Tax=Polymorphospora sp. NPDC050346 TaxID=3155780 RepID=UPI0033C22B4A
MIKVEREVDVSLVDTIQAGLQTLTAGNDRAAQETVVVDHAIQQTGIQAAASGFVGVARNLALVRTVIGQIRTALSGMAAVAREAATTLAATPQQPAPQEITATLGAVSGNLNSITDGICRCIGQVDQAKQVTVTVLRGGDPGTLLARLDAIHTVLAAVGQRVAATRHQVEAATAEARSTGSSGEWSRSPTAPPESTAEPPDTPVAHGGDAPDEPAVGWSSTVDGQRLVASLPAFGGRGSKTAACWSAPI